MSMLQMMLRACPTILAPSAAPLATARGNQLVPPRFNLMNFPTLVLSYSWSAPTSPTPNASKAAMPSHPLSATSGVFGSASVWRGAAQQTELAGVACAWR
jgi:hypothetical protein